MGLRDRLNRLSDLLIKDNLDAAIIMSRDNLAYFLGFEDALMLVIRPGREYIAVVSRLDYERAIDRMGSLVDVVAFSTYEKPPRRSGEKLFVGKSLMEYLESVGIRGRVGVDSQDSRITRGQSISWSTVSIEDKVWELRMIKDQEELENMVMSIKITEETIDEVVNKGLVGLKERDVAALFYLGFLSRGAGDVAFKPIVAAQENAAYPHHEPGPRVINRGDLVVLDVGARYNLYCADITRTVATGSLNLKLRDIYEAVLEAQRKAIDAAGPGVLASNVDNAAREVLNEYGFGEYYIHSTGHGVGVVVHEKPYLGPSSSETLGIGNVVTIEPGVYVRGLGGVRIEDMVLITETGRRVLSTYPREI